MGSYSVKLFFWVVLFSAIHKLLFAISVHDGVVRARYIHPFLYVLFSVTGKDSLSRFFYISTKKCFATFIEETLNLTLGLFMVVFPRSPGWKIKFIILKLAQVRFVFTPNVAPLCFVFHVSFSLTAFVLFKCNSHLKLHPVRWACWYFLTGSLLVSYPADMTRMLLYVYILRSYQICKSLF